MRAGCRPRRPRRIAGARSATASIAAVTTPQSASSTWSSTIGIDRRQYGIQRLQIRRSVAAEVGVRFFVS